MAIAAALLMENEEEYRAFREEALARYTPTTGIVKAEHLLKVCLIHPTDSRIVALLRREIDTMGDPLKAPCPAWSALSLSLYYFRTGGFDDALKTCRQGLISPERKSSCEASLEAVAAMAHASMGRTDLAAAALLRARAIAETCKGKDFAWGSPIRPYWFDWAIAGLLIKEAEDHVSPPSQ